MTTPRRLNWRTNRSLRGLLKLAYKSVRVHVRYCPTGCTLEAPHLECRDGVELYVLVHHVHDVAQLGRLPATDLQIATYWKVPGRWELNERDQRTGLLHEWKRERKRTPQVLSVECPVCAAERGAVCRGLDGNAHAERHQAATDAKYAKPVAEANGDTGDGS